MLVLHTLISAALDIASIQDSYSDLSPALFKASERSFLSYGRSSLQNREKNKFSKFYHSYHQSQKKKPSHNPAKFSGRLKEI